MCGAERVQAEQAGARCCIHCCKLSALNLLEVHCTVVMLQQSRKVAVLFIYDAAAEQKGLAGAWKHLAV